MLGERRQSKDVLEQKQLMIKNFKSLNIWIRSRALVKDIYRISKKLPKDEMYGLTSQIRRAAVSVPSNIAEGCGRNHLKELIQFLNIAIASLCEIETQLYLTMDLEYTTEKEIEPIINETIEIRRMIAGYINSLKK